MDEFRRRQRPNFTPNGQLVSRPTIDDSLQPQLPSEPKPKKHWHKNKHKDKQPGRFKKIVKRTFLTLVLLILVGGGWFGWNLYRDASKLTGDNNPWQIISALWPAHLKETDGRVNILLTGYSADDPGHGGATLTDSIMVLSIDPSTKTALTLSIPRDLYVNIPGHGYSKINAAYEYGQADNFNESGYDSGGIGLMEKVIQQDFGVQTNYYALINYTAFRDTVNAVGGVTIAIKSQDPRGLYDPYTNLKLPNGEVKLDGQTALNLARARGDGPGSYGFPQSDFDRTQHQREILVALKDKVGTRSLLLDPFKVLRLSSALGNNVKTDMHLNELESLYNIMRKVPDSDIKSVGLNDYNGTDLLAPYTDPYGESTLIPAAGLDNYTAIQTALDNLLGTDN